MRTSFRSIVLLFAILMTGDVAYAAGFKCTGALQKDEKVVCSDEDLSRLDDQLNSVYQEALTANFETADKVRSDQRAFLVSRRACAINAGCMRSLYSARIDELSRPQIFEPEKKAQDSTLAAQAQKLLSLALKCPAKPVQTGGAAYKKLEYESVGDSAVLRIKGIVHDFQGFKFPGQKMMKTDIPIPGVNAASDDMGQVNYSAGLKSIAAIEAYRWGELRIACARGNKCIKFDSAWGQGNCKSFDGASCGNGRESSAKDQLEEMTLEGICPSQVKNAGDALSILVSAAKYGQTK
ncbi:lysozyme inhibitor LprI family protein [Bradyrhizobium erythrophlei]|uniref:Lysozyme inhibitor LprI-like N-terminal domain-containing protein n=1 Tax=Bradyrhizobium erythrophlei TaxID=1437360 RepID=A0A1H4NN99_9BRAD|nr:lysozyme inhibitor LprI family protein [Bradyrhizobium erythrophlei]SEB96415.1 Protein of unknown function [Bradyrhizobium erythrophlei]